MLPNFFLIGAMKSGTTSLHRYLNSHPQVFMSRIKELDFFTEELEWHRGLEWYEEQFADAGGAVAVGESSTSYSKYPFYKGVPERIAKIVPDAKLLYVIREPIDRMRSQYLHEVSKEREHEPIEIALRADSNYVNWSRYAMQIERYLESFPKEQLLVLLSEDLRSNRKGVLAEASRFLGIDPEWDDPTIEHEYNPTATRRLPKPIEHRVRALPGFKKLMKLTPKLIRRKGRQLTTRPMTPEVETAVVTAELRAELEEVLREDVQRLYEYLPSHFDGWGIA